MRSDSALKHFGDLSVSLGAWFSTKVPWSIIFTGFIMKKGKGKKRFWVWF